MQLKKTNSMSSLHSMDTNETGNKRKPWVSLSALTLLLLACVLVINSCKDEETTPAPDIASFSPASGGEGSELTISGTNFSAAENGNQVMINTLPATLTKASETSLTVTVPVGATTGKIKVTVNGNTVVSEDDFTVISSSKMLGETGGKVTGSDGRISIDLPQGALDNNTVVSVEQENESAPNGIGKIYTLSPEGTQFAKPVQLSFQYTDEDLAGSSPTELGIAFREGEGEWQVMESVEINEQTKTITTQTTHFSQWTLLKVPSITSITPGSGQVGDEVTINGTNFSPVIAQNQIFFNGIAATVTFANASSLKANVPQGATTGKIKVVTIFNNVTYNLQSKKDFSVEESDPVITSWFPSSGPVGTAVLISGSGFSPNSTDNIVTFNGTTAAITSSTTTEITATVPAGATTGNIIVTTKFNNLPFTINSGLFTVTGNEPKITSFAPSNGSAGTTVVIDGSNFSTNASDNHVLFNGTEAAILQSSATQLTVKVPVGTTTGKITVLTIFGTFNYTVTSATDFVVLSVDEPTLTTFSPSTGTAGTFVTISGTGFSMNIADNKVFFNGTPATVMTVTTSGTAGTLTAKVPAGATSGKILITLPFNNLSYTVTSASDFTVESSEPVITGFTPASAKAGALVTINGKNFGGSLSDNQVMFNGKPATIVTFSPTQIIVKVPLGATSGRIILLTLFNSFSYVATSSTDFVVESSAPVITAFSPVSAAPGTSVTITGKNFSTNTAENSVFFNGVEATVTAASATALVVIVPASATTGRVIVSVLIDAVEYSTTSAEDFTVIP